MSYSTTARPLWQAHKLPSPDARQAILSRLEPVSSDAALVYVSIEGERADLRRTRRVLRSQCADPTGCQQWATAFAERQISELGLGLEYHDRFLAEFPKTRGEGAMKTKKADWFLSARLQRKFAGDEMFADLVEGILLCGEPIECDWEGSRRKLVVMGEGAKNQLRHVEVVFHPYMSASCWEWEVLAVHDPLATPWRWDPTWRVRRCDCSLFR